MDSGFVLRTPKFHLNQTRSTFKIPQKLPFSEILTLKSKKAENFDKEYLFDQLESLYMEILKLLKIFPEKFEVFSRVLPKNSKFS
jgi:hypothetical protein